MAILNNKYSLAHPRIENDMPEVIATAHGISGYLHYCIKTPQCTSNFTFPCDMCINASRLVMQNVIPKIVDEIMNKIHYTLGWHCSVPHPSSD